MPLQRGRAREKRAGAFIPYPQTLNPGRQRKGLKTCHRGGFQEYSRPLLRLLRLRRRPSPLRPRVFPHSPFPSGSNMNLISESRSPAREQVADGEQPSQPSGDRHCLREFLNVQLSPMHRIKHQGVGRRSHDRRTQIYTCTQVDRGREGVSE